MATNAKKKKPASVTFPESADAYLVDSSTLTAQGKIARENAAALAENQSGVLRTMKLLASAVATARGAIRIKDGKHKGAMDLQGKSPQYRDWFRENVASVLDEEKNGKRVYPMEVRVYLIGNRDLPGKLNGNKYGNLRTHVQNAVAAQYSAAQRKKAGLALTSPNTRNADRKNGGNQGGDTTQRGIKPLFDADRAAVAASEKNGVKVLDVCAGFVAASEVIASRASEVTAKGEREKCRALILDAIRNAVAALNAMGIESEEVAADVAATATAEAVAS